MPTPQRIGIDEKTWKRLIAPLDRMREKALKRVAVTQDIGGTLAIWSRSDDGVVIAREMAIQPGVADDPPSLLSSLAAEIGWPGAGGDARAIAVWARVWQVREGADLRVTLRWDELGIFHGRAELLRNGAHELLMDTAALVALLDRVAVAPVESESPHALLIAGNRAMQAEDFSRARDLYERAVRDLPRHPEASRNLALALARLDAWEDASAAMREAVTLSPKDPALAREFLALETDAGIRAAQQGEHERAAAHFLRILEHRPDEPTALLNLGNIRLREQRPAEARAIFTRFLRLHPAHPAAEKIRLLMEGFETLEN